MNNFSPLAATPNTISRDMLAPPPVVTFDITVAGGPPDFTPVVQSISVDTMFPSAFTEADNDALASDFGGVVPSSTASIAGFPPCIANFDNNPVVLGWAGQFQYMVQLGPPAPPVTLPPRPLQGFVPDDPVYGNVAVYEPSPFFGMPNTPIAMPSAIFTNSPVNIFGMGTTLDDPGIAAQFTNAGINYICLDDGNFNEVNGGTSCYYPFVWPFPISGSVDAGIQLAYPLFNTTDDQPVMPVGTPLDDVAIDPTSFTGGQILAFSWNGAVPYGPITFPSYNLPPPGTAIFSGDGIATFSPDPDTGIPNQVPMSMIANQIAQVTAAVGSLVKFRHVMVFDVNMPTNDATAAILSQLVAPWLQTATVDFTDSNAVVQLIQQQAADFFGLTM